jgi:hypothetical protein
VAGYARLICLLIACLIRVSPTIAQVESARFLWATSDSQGFIAHLSIPRGLSITSAELKTNVETLALTVRPLPLAVEQWIILDSGLGVVNTAPAIQAAALDFVAEASPERQFGLIRFAQAIEIMSPTSRPSDLEAWLGDYHALSTESGCLADALSLLDLQTHERERARLVLAIVGAYQDCTPFPAIESPIELIVVGAESHAAYTELAESSGGMIYRASLQSLRARLSEVAVLWSQPVFALEGTSPSLAEGTVKLSLSNGENLEIAIRYDLNFVPTTTPAPSDTPTNSPSSTATLVETASSETVLPAETANATNIPTELAILPTDAPVPTVAAEVPGPLPISNNNLIVGGGLAAGLVVIVVMALLLRGVRRPKRSKEQGLDNTLLFQYNNEAELDQTDIVSMREMMSKVRQTLAARLTDEAGTVYEVHRPITTLGRKEDSDIRIENDKQISREHLRFSVRDDDSIWITRLTQNPVLLNQIAVETILQIKDGDVLQLSPSLRLKLEIVADE